MKSPIPALRLFLVLAWLTVLGARPAAAQTPPAEFSTNLTQGATTLGFHFVYHPIRNPDFTVQVQTSGGTFTNFTPDVPRTYLGWSSNAPDALACATLLPDGTLWAGVVFGDGFTWYFQNGTATASSTRGATNWPAKWPTTPTLGPGGAGTNIYAATVGVDVRWTYFNACGGDLNTLLRHVKPSVMAAPSGNYDASALSSLGLVATGTGTLAVGAVPVEPSEPPTLGVSQADDALTLAWPPAYTSFALYVQTNALAAGLGTNWLPVPGVVSNVVTVPVNRAVPAVFYQLRKNAGP